MSQETNNESAGPVYDIVVCGSGPAGLSAALAAAERGAKVLVCEKQNRFSTKLLASGGGKCNFTNALPENKFMDSFGRNGRFMTDALRVGGRDFLLDFLKKHDVEPVLEDGMYYFPSSGYASDIQDAFMETARTLGAEMKTGLQINRVIVDDNGNLTGVETGSGTYPCRKLILAAGGTAMSALGGTSSGLELARAAGHTIVKPLPAMAPLLVQERYLYGLAGVSLPAAALSFSAERRHYSASGEIVFTHNGISGPAALDISAPAYRVFDRDGTLCLRFTPVDKMDMPKWINQLLQMRKEETKKLVRNAIAKFMPHSLADELTREYGIYNYTCGEMGNSLIEEFSHWLTMIPLHISALCPMDKAMAMSGGVSLKEVNPKTMESKIVKGLYFAGEILDLAGPCGGFHIQFAVASGRLAGLSAAI